jgi:low affinity Fe/Cu permease
MDMSSTGRSNGHHRGDESVRDAFDRLAGRLTRAVGSPTAVVIAAFVILAWAVTGPVFGYSDTWQLAINTGTTVVTFLMVFLIQATQNRDSEALHLKLDELIRAVQGARNEFITVEQETEEELTEREREMAELVESVAREAGHPDPKAEAKRAVHAATRAHRGATARPRTE